MLPREGTMTATSLTRDPEEALDQERTPHLSYSRINRYLTCPEQYRLYYVENLVRLFSKGCCRHGSLPWERSL